MKLVPRGSVEEQLRREVHHLREKVAALERSVEGWREAWEAMLDAASDLYHETRSKPFGRRKATATQILRIMKFGAPTAYEKSP